MKNIKTFTDQQISDWKRFEKVRSGGKWNMFSSQALTATGLTKERFLFVMSNFGELELAAN
jgi:hypothetical protein